MMVDRAKAPGEDIALAAGFAICGAIWYYFPIYANLNGVWASIFRNTSYAWYVFAILGALVGLQSTMNSEFIKHLMAAVLFGALAWGVHYLSRSLLFPWQTLLRAIVLALTMMATLFAVTGVPHLFSGRRHGEVIPGESRPRSTTETIASLVVAILALVTASLQLYAEWLKHS